MRRPTRSCDDDMAEGSEYMGIGTVTTLDHKTPGREVVIIGFRPPGYVEPKKKRARRKKGELMADCSCRDCEANKWEKEECATITREELHGYLNQTYGNRAKAPPMAPTFYNLSADGIDMPARLKRIASDLGDVLAEKNRAYGSSFARSGEILGILFPNGVKPGQMRDMQLISRVIDKLFRVANRVDGKDAGGESPWLDVAGYSVCALSLEEEK